MRERQDAADLGIREDMRRQRAEWIIERAGWALIALVLVAALAGLLGHGPLSRATAGEPGSRLWAEYHRFERHQAPTELRVHLGPGAGSGGELRVWVGRGYLDAIELERVDPEPVAVEAGADQHVFVFAMPDPGRPTSVLFRFQPDTYGSLRGRLGLPDGEEVTFDQFAYP